MPVTDFASASNVPEALVAFRRYVSDFVNRHDFGALPRVMQPGYELLTSGHRITGRDGSYREAVARQLEQFPGLQFTVHDLFVAGQSIGVRFSEHGRSSRHDGAAATWASIAIYDVRDGLLARCTIEQDYMARRAQLEGGSPNLVDRVAIAPWDEVEAADDEGALKAAADWLESGDWLEDGRAEIDESASTGRVDPVLGTGSLSVLRGISGRNRAGELRVAFHALQQGPVLAEFAAAAGGRAGDAAEVHLSGLVKVRGGRVCGGHIIRDRWGLFRRLAKAGARTFDSAIKDQK